MRIYEMLGVKVFKKILFFSRDRIFCFFNRKMSKQENYNLLYKTPTNYNIGKIKSVEDIKNFKSKLFLNAIIHIISLCFCIPGLTELVSGAMLSLPDIIFNTFIIVLNSYCIMLQRYNHLRIEQVIKNNALHCEKQKDMIKETLREKDSLFLTHSYKIVDEEEKEHNITFEDLLSYANIDQLKRYRRYFTNIQNSLEKLNNSNQNDAIDISIPIDHCKFLKLTLEPGTHSKNA